MKRIPIDKAKGLILNIMSIADMESKIRVNNSILGDKNWASSDCDYHKGCRRRLEEQNAKLTEVLVFLKDS